MGFANLRVRIAPAIEELNMQQFAAARPMQAFLELFRLLAKLAE